jgi:hypothetical protein
VTRNCTDLSLGKCALYSTGNLMSQAAKAFRRVYR